MDKTTFAERIRTASDKELATILLNYLEGAIMPWCVINNMPVPKFDEAMIL